MQTIGRVRGPTAQWFVVLVLSCTVGISSCNRPVPPVETPVVVEDNAVQDVRVPDETFAARKEMATPETAPAGNSGEPGDDGTVVKPRGRVERFVLFTPRGPLVVHLQILVHGQPQSLVIEQLLAAALQAGGAKGSGDANWSELVASPGFATGQWGNVPAGSPADRQRITQEFDFNRDGRVQRDELTACLAQNNAGGRAFSIQPATDYGGDDKLSPLFALLDQDQDGQLSAAEMAAACERLRSRDADNDDAVTAADLRPPVSNNQAIQGSSAGGTSPQAVELTRLKMDSIYYSLGERYDIGNGVDRASFALTPGLAAQLDLDGNDKIDQQEMLALRDARLDLLLKISFGQTPSGEREPMLELVTMSDDLIAAGAESHPQNGGIEFVLPGCELDAFANDVARETDPQAVFAAQFARLDANKDGVLDSTELSEAGTAAGLKLMDLDKDGDGQLSLDEARAAMGKQPSYAALQVQVRVGEIQDPLFSWLDLNHDGRLTSRDLLGAAGRLAQLDRDGDGFATLAEIPERLSLLIVRGIAPRDPRNQPSRPLYVSQPQSSQQAPAWMVAMDQNGDGEISQREFPGSPEQFGRMDVNADGFLDVSEALLAETEFASPTSEEAGAVR